MSHYREKEHHDLMFCWFFLKKKSHIGQLYQGR